MSKAGAPKNGTMWAWIRFAILAFGLGAAWATVRGDVSGSVKDIREIKACHAKHLEESRAVYDDVRDGLHKLDKDVALLGQKLDDHLARRDSTMKGTKP